MSIGYCANCVERCEGQHGPCFSEEIGCTEDFRPEDALDDESTSARLARAERELDAERSKVVELAALYESATGETARVERERDALKAELVEAQRETYEAREAMIRTVGETVKVQTELVSARQELARLRNSAAWVVARDGGRACETCDQEIRRGEAYMHSGWDRLSHIHCPDRHEGATTA